MAGPCHFLDDPALAWGFHGHRTNLYRGTIPHDGFAILRHWVEAAPLGGFVFTSNVDDHFGRSGFDRDRIVEAHGSIEWRQCLKGCAGSVFPADLSEIKVDPSTFRAAPPLPNCPRCGGLARPNILMFGDSGWLADRTEEQLRRFSGWLGAVGGARMVVVEIGAGRAVPTVRRLSEALVQERGASLIRINVREADVPKGQVGFGSSALLMLQTIDREFLGDRSSGDRLDQG